MFSGIQSRGAAIFAGLTFRLVLLAVIALLIVNTYADISLKGPLGIGFHFEGWKPKAKRLQRDLEATLEAGQQAQQQQQAVNDTAEQIYRDVAERIDDETEHARAGALDDAERFIAANRVRCPNGGGTSGASAAAFDRGAGDGEALPGATELDGSGAVAVPETDIRVCTVNTLQAEAGALWAREIEEASANPR